jgi:hypothetical protein
MVTSRSSDSDNKGEWIAGAWIFSGRPDPKWTVPLAAAQRLVTRLESMSEATEVIPVAPRLGYRGCFLRSPSGREWRAYRGLVESRWQGEVERRRDEGQWFEKQLLELAPRGLLPNDVIAW